MFSWFKKKQQEAPKPKVDLGHLPALNEWGVFFQGAGFSLYSRWAGGVPGTESENIYLKSFPEVPELERHIYADWLSIGAKGIYLQRRTDAQTETATLVYVDFASQQHNVIKEHLLINEWEQSVHELVSK